MYSQFKISGSTPTPKPPAVPNHMVCKAKFVDGVIQRCARPLCQTVFTPQWRRGPSGKTDYCNACGLNYANDLKTGKRTPVVQKISSMSINSLLAGTVEATYTPEEEKTRKDMEIHRILN